MNINLSKIEQLEQEISDDNIDLVNYPFKSERLKGITYINKGKKCIGINKSIESSSKRLEILNEEYTHCQLTAKDISCDRAEENKARFKSYQKLVPLSKLIESYQKSLNLYEMAEDIGITYEYLIECLEAYSRRYGISTKCDGYLIQFSPVLNIEKIEA